MKRNGPLQEALRLYEAGDVVAARESARKALAAASEGSPEQAEARELIARTQVPLFAWRYAAFAVAALAGMLALAIVRG
jgi:hypothetical protein